MREGEEERERGGERKHVCAECALRCVVCTSREATVSTSYI